MHRKNDVIHRSLTSLFLSFCRKPCASHVLDSPCPRKHHDLRAAGCVTVQQALHGVLVVGPRSGLRDTLLEHIQGALKAHRRRLLKAAVMRAAVVAAVRAAVRGEALSTAAPGGGRHPREATRD